MTQATFARGNYSFPLNIRHLLHVPKQVSMDQEIVTGTWHRYRYGDFFQRMEKLAAGLAALGVKPQDTVAVLNWDCHRYLECFFAVPMMGAILHTVNVRLGAEQVLYTINHAEDHVLIVHEDFIPLILEISERIRHPCKKVIIRDNCETGEATSDFDINYESLLDLGAGWEFIDVDESAIATTFYTTGTTGSPKGVFYTHRQIVLHTLGALNALAPLPHPVRLHNADVYLPMTPLFHVHGWGIPYIATMLGIKQVYPSRFDPNRLVDLIQKEQVTFSHCVPTILHLLLAALAQTGRRLDGLKVLVGGSALPQGLAKTALQFGIQLCAAYGLSETGPFVSVADTRGIDHTSLAGDDLAPRCKTGKPAGLVEMRVVNQQMRDIPAHQDAAPPETGEIILRAPWLTPGYVGSQEASDTLWADGYLHTGDAGYFDNTKTLRITDRLKDLIKSGGEWISSLALENLVSQIDGVSEVAAIGIADEKWGERPLLLVVSGEADSKAVRQAIIACLDEQARSGAISKWAIPRHIEFVESIAKTSVGKIDKKRLREIYRRRIASVGE